MTRRIRNPRAYHEAVERNEAKWDRMVQANKEAYWRGVTKALIKMTGGDSREDWQKRADGDLV